MPEQNSPRVKPPRPKQGQKRRPHNNKVINQRAKTARMDDELFLCWGCKAVFDGGKIFVHTEKGKVPYCRECCETRGYKTDGTQITGPRAK
jgi:hypothetical protein